jgi:predicted AlkP superfamily pyrophosphatase or phosphodiesterase
VCQQVSLKKFTVMYKRLFSIILVFNLLSICNNSIAQNSNLTHNVRRTTRKRDDSTYSRPKLVVGIVIDQMRWDYLYRFNDLFKPNGGFKRLLNDGFSCENTFIPYVPTVTAAGHTCIYTGSVPAIHGIVGNNWFDNFDHRKYYCTDDSTVKTVGDSSINEGKMSPRNMFVTTIGDELRLATNFKSKVIGISIKDRAAILPAGHAANAAYWYDKKGNFISSTYYMDSLPLWVQAFNKRKITDSLYSLGWVQYLPWNLTTQSYPYLDYCTEDTVHYEDRPFGNAQTKMPYDLSRYIGKDYSKIATTPGGNVLLEQMAEAAISNEQLGKGRATDMLAVSFSSPDYIGHAFGPNSWEQLDDYVRLDDVLGRFFHYLDSTVGEGQYVVFLTADHGVSHIPGFDSTHNLPGGYFNPNTIVDSLNAGLKNQFGKDSLVVDLDNFQVTLNHQLIESASLNKKDIEEWSIDYLQRMPAIAQVFPVKEISTYPITSMQREMITNGYYPQRCGDIEIVLKPAFVEGYGPADSHGVWNPYDSHIPLLWYGWDIKHGATNRETYMTDIAATLAALLHIQMPDGCIGKVIPEVMKN